MGVRDLRLLIHFGALAIELSNLAIDWSACGHDFDESSMCVVDRVVECTIYTIDFQLSRPNGPEGLISTTDPLPCTVCVDNRSTVDSKSRILLHF